MLEHLTIISAYYNQPMIMEEWWDALREYPKALRKKISLRFVDDHSKDHPLAIPKSIFDSFDVMAFRVLDDITWNEMGARNLAMKHAEGWVYMTDPDYILKADQCERLFGTPVMARGQEHTRVEPIQRGFMYHLRSRHYSTHKDLPRPENIAIVHSEDFWKVGGYDEDFAGGYGFSDTLLFHALKVAAGVKDTFVEDVHMDHYPMGVIMSAYGDQAISDAASPANRDTTRNQPIHKRVRSNVAHKGWKRYIRERKPPIRFKWERFV